MHVTVTGGAGFIGANLCHALVSGNHAVTVLDDFSTGFESNLDGLPVKVHRGSVCDREAVRDAMAVADAVVHLAARPSVPRSIADPIASHDANATGTLLVLEEARQRDTYVVVASSSSVYGANPTLPKHEGLMAMPVSPYAVSKLATESYALAYQESFGARTLAFRFFNVYGPLQPAGHAYAAVIPAFVDAAMKAEPLPMYGDGLQTRDFTFVDTLVAVLVDAVRRQVVHPGPVNLAFGTRTSLLELVGLLDKILGRSLEVHQFPQRKGDVRESQADNSLLLSLFPEVCATPLAVGLARTVEWFTETSLRSHGSPLGKSGRAGQLLYQGE